MNFRDNLKDAEKIVIKVGTSTLVYENGNINLGRIEKLARVISDIENSGKKVILVSSGAIGIGINKLKLEKKPDTICGKQAVAAVGQCEMMQIYGKFFGEYNYSVGQVLLTRDVIEDDHIRKNVKNTFRALLRNNIIPVVNENDTVAIDEIENIVRFGDNDNLSAIVAKLIEADLLIILSDIDGFYDDNPKENENAKIMSVITDITPEIEECAGGSGSNFGTGGMVTKIEAAKTATAAGVNVVLADGSEPDIIRQITDGEDIGTLFVRK